MPQQQEVAYIKDMYTIQLLDTLPDSLLTHSNFRSLLIIALYM